MITQQFTLYLENKPGMLAKLTRAFGAAKINIEGISVAESTDTALVQVIVDDPVKTGTVLKRAKVPFTAQKVCVIDLAHKPGSLAALSSRLAAARVNINYIYATAAPDHGISRVVVGADNLGKVEKAAR